MSEHRLAENVIELASWRVKNQLKKGKRAKNISGKTN